MQAYAFFLHCIAFFHSVRASEPTNVCIYFENNKQNVWTSVHIWLTRSGPVMKTECDREHFKLNNFSTTNYIQKEMGKKQQPPFATDKIWWLLFLRQCWRRYDYLHNVIERDHSTRMKQTNALLFRINLRNWETKRTNEEIGEKTQKQQLIEREKKHVAHDRHVAYLRSALNIWIIIYLALLNILNWPIDCLYYRLSKSRLSLLLLEYWTNIYAFDLHLIAFIHIKLPGYKNKSTLQKGERNFKLT